MRSCVPANDVIKLSLLFIFADRWECKKGMGGGGSHFWLQIFPQCLTFLCTHYVCCGFEHFLQNSTLLLTKNDKIYSYTKIKKTTKFWCTYSVSKYCSPVCTSQCILYTVQCICSVYPPSLSPPPPSGWKLDPIINSANQGAGIFIKNLFVF